MQHQKGDTSAAFKHYASKFIITEVFTFKVIDPSGMVSSTTASEGQTVFGVLERTGPLRAVTLTVIPSDTATSTATYDQDYTLSPTVTLNQGQQLAEFAIVINDDEVRNRLRDKGSSRQLKSYLLSLFLYLLFLSVFVFVFYFDPPFLHVYVSAYFWVLSVSCVHLHLHVSNPVLCFLLVSVQ